MAYDGFVLFVFVVLFESCIIIIWQNATGCSPHLLQRVFTLETDQDHKCIFKMAGKYNFISCITVAEKELLHILGGEEGQMRGNQF